MGHFAVIRERGPTWDPDRAMREQAGWDEHAAFMEALAADGFVELGGPVGDAGELILLVICAASRREVERRLDLDPWSPAGLLRVVSVERYDVRLRHR
jgi:hypothetical protein